MKNYFVRTNGYDMIVSVSDDEIRIFDEVHFPTEWKEYISDENYIKCLEEIEDVSSWEICESTFEEIVEDAEILAEADFN